MPIYEFYCEACHMLFNFFSKRIDTDTCPRCPKCRQQVLSRQVSLFSVTGKAKSSEDGEDLPFDESKMERAMQALAREADRIDENDPRQAANLMRKLTDMTGMKLGEGMEEALRRMEKGEDPDAIESEMSDLLESEDPFEMMGEPKTGRAAARRAAPMKDETLYDLHPDEGGVE